MPLAKRLAGRLVCPKLKVLLCFRRDVADERVFCSAVEIDELDFSIAFAGD